MAESPAWNMPHSYRFNQPVAFTGNVTYTRVLRLLQPVRLFIEVTVRRLITRSLIKHVFQHEEPSYDSFRLPRYLRCIEIFRPYPFFATIRFSIVQSVERYREY